MPEIEFPEFPRARVFVGGCVEGGTFRRSAHAHNRKDQPSFGWICVMGAKSEHVRLHDGTPNNTMKHEYAHILAPNQGHTGKFFRALLALGGYVEGTYYKSRDFKKHYDRSKRAKWGEVAERVREDRLEVA